MKVQLSKQIKTRFLVMGLCGLSIHFAMATRVAILPTAGLEDAEAMLTTVLSSNPNLDVMERAQVESIVREKNLQSLLTGSEEAKAVGQLLV